MIRRKSVLPVRLENIVKKAELNVENVQNSTRAKEALRNVHVSFEIG